MVLAEIRCMRTTQYDGSRSEMDNLLSQVLARWHADFDYSLSGSVNFDDSIILQPSERNYIDNMEDIPPSVVNEVRSSSGSNGADAVIVFDGHSYENVDGVAQIGSVGGPGVAVLGNYGHNETVAYHELLHMFEARHRDHTVIGESITKGTTIMGDPETTSCMGNDHGRLSKYLDPSECARDSVDIFVGEYKD